MSNNRFEDYTRQEHKPGFARSALRGAIEGLMYYPLVRLQTVYQTADLAAVKDLTKNGNNGKSSFFYKNLFSQVTRGNLLNLYVGFSPYIAYYIGYKTMLSIFYPRGTGVSDLANATLLSVGLAAVYPFELTQIRQAYKINTDFKEYNSRNLISRYGDVLSNYTKASSFTGVSAFIAKNLCISYGIVLSQLSDNKIYFFVLTLLATAIDNVRRNYVIMKTNGENVSMKQVTAQIIKERGYLGLHRGYFLYPYLLMMLTSLGKKKHETELRDQRFLYSH